MSSRLKVRATNWGDKLALKNNTLSNILNSIYTAEGIAPSVSTMSSPRRPRRTATIAAPASSIDYVLSGDLVRGLGDLPRTDKRRAETAFQRLGRNEKKTFLMHALSEHRLLALEVLREHEGTSKFCSLVEEFLPVVIAKGCETGRGKARSPALWPGKQYL
jgi:hypothetical protein